MGKEMKKGIKYLIFFALTLIVMLPFFWTLYAAFVKNDLDLNTKILQQGKYGFENFKYILSRGEIFIWLKNSVITVSAITAANLLINTMAGYALARFEFKGKKTIFTYITASMMIPAQVLVIPIFLIISKLGMINTYAGLIIPFMFNPFGVFLMRQHFLTFPKEIEEAASIDGLGAFMIFFKVCMPLAKNALMTQAILIFVWNWNSFILPSILVNRQDMFTLPLGMYQLTNTRYVTSITKSMAGAVLTLLPTIIFYLIFQKRLINNDMNSAVKG